MSARTGKGSVKEKRTGIDKGEGVKSLQNCVVVL